MSLNAEELKRYDAYPLLVQALKDILMAPSTRQEMQAMRKAAHLLADLDERAGDDRDPD